MVPGLKSAFNFLVGFVLVRDLVFYFFKCAHGNHVGRVPEWEHYFVRLRNGLGGASLSGMSSAGSESYILHQIHLRDDAEHVIRQDGVGELNVPDVVSVCLVHGLEGLRPVGGIRFPAEYFTNYGVTLYSFPIGEVPVKEFPGRAPCGPTPGMGEAGEVIAISGLPVGRHKVVPAYHSDS